MIKLNGEPIDVTKFPDGTMLMRIQTDDIRVMSDDENGEIIPSFFIEWLYDSDSELLQIMYMVKHIRDHSPIIVPISLYMPYIPNARMDRVKDGDEVFTLKWFSDIINSLEFDEVYVLDPHSNVATALIDRVRIIDPSEYIYRSIVEVEKESGENVMVCYPDEGAYKRYSGIINEEYVFCIKHRDWKTGVITGLELTNAPIVKGRDVLIVDDICSRGGTFTHTAMALKEAGAHNVYLYVTHCENTIEKGSLLVDGLIEKVFTTRSICRVKNDMVVYIDDIGGDD